MSATPAPTTVSHTERNIFLGTLGIIGGAGLIYLLASLLIYFLDRTAPAVQKSAEVPFYNLLGYNATMSGVLAPGSSNEIPFSAASIPQNGTTSSSSTTAGGQSGTSMEPMIVYVPQNQTIPASQPNGSSSQTTVVITPGPTGTAGQRNSLISIGNIAPNAQTPNVQVPSIQVPNVPINPDNIPLNVTIPPNPVSFNGGITPTGLSLDPAIDPPVLSDPSFPLSASYPQILPDNPLYMVKDFNNQLSDTFTFNPLEKTYNYLTQANDKSLEGMLLLQKNTASNDEQLAVTNFGNATDLIGSAQQVLQSSLNNKPNGTVGLFDGMSNSLMVEQLFMLASENINDNKIAMAIDAIRTKHLAETGSILNTIVNHSSNNVSILPTFISSSIQSPVDSLHTIDVLNAIQNSSGIKSSPAISLLQQALTNTVIQELTSLPVKEQLQTLLAYAGSSPIRQIQGIQTLDELQTITGNAQFEEIAHTASDLTVNNLGSTLTKLTQDDQEAFLNHFVTGSLPDFKSLLTLDAHLGSSNNQLSSEILSAKNDALQKIVARITNNPSLLQNDLFVQHLLSKPDIYDLALINTLQQAVQKTNNPKAIQALTNAKDIALTNFVTQVGNSQEKLLAIPYTSELLSQLNPDLTPKAQGVIQQALQGYNQDLGTYLLQDVTNKQILTAYQGQLQATSAPISSLAQQVTTRLAQPILQSVSQPVSTTTVTQPIQATVGQVTQTTQSVVPQTVIVQQPVQQVIQQVPQVIQNVTNNQQSSSNTNNSLLHIPVPTIKLPL